MHLYNSEYIYYSENRLHSILYLHRIYILYLPDKYRIYTKRSLIKGIHTLVHKHFKEKKGHSVMIDSFYPHFTANLSSFMEEDDTLSLSFYIHFHCMK